MTLKKISKVCKRAEDRFRGLLEAAPDAMVIVNHLGIIELVNSQTERMFGYARDELLGKPVEVLVPDQFRGHHRAHRENYAEAPSNRRIGNGRILSARRKDGSEFPAEIGISPLQTEDGMLVVSSIRDVTERTQAEELVGKLNSELEARVLRRTEALRKANDKLHHEIATRRRLEQEILEISEREQQRIGRDLHDDLGQRLVGISYLSRVLANELATTSSPEADQAAKITELLNHALALTRSLARGLDPVALESGGLTAALADLAERTAGIFQIGCVFSGAGSEPLLPQSTATHLYRIAQEAVTNAAHHGRATAILIELSQLGHRTILTITDNGSGMPKPNPRFKGMGLHIMHYRADVIGASLGFSSSEFDGGTVITCTVPK